eukprot:scaffold4951_cov106-Isochrysis_galbana.AAC.3
MADRTPSATPCVEPAADASNHRTCPSASRSNTRCTSRTSAGSACGVATRAGAMRRGRARTSAAGRRSAGLSSRGMAKASTVARKAAPAMPQLVEPSNHWRFDRIDEQQLNLSVAQPAGYYT